MEAQAKAYYFEILYPFQNQVLDLITHPDGFELARAVDAYEKLFQEKRS